MCTAVGSPLRVSSATSVSHRLHFGSEFALINFPSDIIETKNRSLEETAAMFDGEEATEQIAGIAHAKVDEPHDEKHSDSSFQEHKSAA